MPGSDCRAESLQRRTAFEDRPNEAGSSCYPRYFAAPERFRVLQLTNVNGTNGQSKDKPKRRRARKTGDQRDVV